MLIAAPDADVRTCGEDGRIQATAIATAAAVSATAASGRRSILRAGRCSRAVTRARNAASVSTSIRSRTARSIAVSISRSVMCVSQRGQLLFQDPARLRDSPLHGADGSVEHRANLFVGVLAGAGEQDRVAKLAGQCRDELFQRPFQVAGSETLFLRPLL